MARDVDLAEVAQHTLGFAGADLAAVVNEAALDAATAGRAEVTQADVVHALDRHQDARGRQRQGAGCAYRELPSTGTMLW